MCLSSSEDGLSSSQHCGHPVPSSASLQFYHNSFSLSTPLHFSSILYLSQVNLKKKKPRYPPFNFLKNSSSSFSYPSLFCSSSFISCSHPSTSSCSSLHVRLEADTSVRSRYMAWLLGGYVSVAPGEDPSSAAPVLLQIHICRRPQRPRGSSSQALQRCCN